MAASLTLPSTVLCLLAFYSSNIACLFWLQGLCICSFVCLKLFSFWYACSDITYCLILFLSLFKYNIPKDLPTYPSKIRPSTKAIFTYFPSLFFLKISRYFTLSYIFVCLFWALSWGQINKRSKAFWGPPLSLRYSANPEVAWSSSRVFQRKTVEWAQAGHNPQTFP